MDKYYLRVEAVNFAYFIYDTDKIQPIRGGSYLLLEGINSLARQEINGITLNKIMTGVRADTEVCPYCKVPAASSDILVCVCENHRQECLCYLIYIYLGIL